MQKDYSVIELARIITGTLARNNREGFVKTAWSKGFATDYEANVTILACMPDGEVFTETVDYGEGVTGQIQWRKVAPDHYVAR